MRFMMIVKPPANSGQPIIKKEFEAMGRYNDELKRAGVLLELNGLTPLSEGSKVKFAGSKRTVLDGPFSEAKEVIGGYCRGEIHSSSSRPIDVPTNPHRTYKNRGWVSWGEFFGTGSLAPYQREFRSYQAARDYVRKQGLVDSKDWRAWCAAGKRPPDIPGAPDAVYAGKGWVSWGEFFGTGNVHPGRLERRPMREAQEFVRRLGVRTKTEFMRAWHTGRIPKDIPLTIDRLPGWKSWASFLGRG